MVNRGAQNFAGSRAGWSLNNCANLNPFGESSDLKLSGTPPGAVSWNSNPTYCTALQNAILTEGLDYSMQARWMCLPAASSANLTQSVSWNPAFLEAPSLTGVLQGIVATALHQSWLLVLDWVRICPQKDLTGLSELHGIVFEIVQSGRVWKGKKKKKKKKKKIAKMKKLFLQIFAIFCNFLLLLFIPIRSDSRSNRGCTIIP